MQHEQEAQVWEEPHKAGGMCIMADHGKKWKKAISEQKLRLKNWVCTEELNVVRRKTYFSSSSTDSLPPQEDKDLRTLPASLAFDYTKNKKETITI